MNQNKPTIATPNGADQPPVLYEDPKLIVRSPFNREVTMRRPQQLCKDPA